jgi:hypothetical protein
MRLARQGLPLRPDAIVVGVVLAQPGLEHGMIPLRAAPRVKAPGKGFQEVILLPQSSGVRPIGLSENKGPWHGSTGQPWHNCTRDRRMPTPY